MESIFHWSCGGELAGSGSITTGNNGSVTVSSGGLLSPGADGAAGTLTLALGTGRLDLGGAVGGAGWLHFDLGTTADEVALITGTLDIGTGLQLSDFNFADAGGFDLGTYVLYDSRTPIIGTLGANISGTVLGFQATLEFADGGNDLVLNVVPEPGSAATLSGGLGGLLGWQRFRRRSRSNSVR